MTANDIHFVGDAPPHAESLSGATAAALWKSDAKRWLRQARHALWRQTIADVRAYRQELFAMSPVEALRSRSTDARALAFGYLPRGLEALAAEAHCTAFFDDTKASWLDAALGTPAWRVAGCGVVRADIFADGRWDYCATRDLAEDKTDPFNGTAVLTIPAYDGPHLVDIFALELGPAISKRRVGRVYFRTGHAIGLGTHSFEATEWRRASTRLALVAHPLDWLKSFAVAPETGHCVPLLDAQPCVWLAGIDPADGSALDREKEEERDRMLVDADPILVDGRRAGFGASVAAALARARKRRMPANPDLMVWTPEPTENAPTAPARDKKQHREFV